MFSFEPRQPPQAASTSHPDTATDDNPFRTPQTGAHTAERLQQWRVVPAGLMWLLALGATYVTLAYAIVLLVLFRVTGNSTLFEYVRGLTPSAVVGGVGLMTAHEAYCAGRAWWQKQWSNAARRTGTSIALAIILLLMVAFSKVASG